MERPPLRNTPKGIGTTGQFTCLKPREVPDGCWTTATSLSKNKRRCKQDHSDCLWVSFPSSGSTLTISPNRRQISAHVSLVFTFWWPDCCVQTNIPNVVDMMYSTTVQISSARPCSCVFLCLWGVEATGNQLPSWFGARWIGRLGVVSHLPPARTVNRASNPQPNPNHDLGATWEMPKTATSFLRAFHTPF